MRDITGTRYGKLCAVKPHSRTSGQSYRWLWACDCGGQKVLHSYSAKKAGQCGCETAAKLAARHRTHGAAATPMYKLYHAMKDRCGNTHNTHYSHYGARGIRVCERWLESYENFLLDMGERPPGTTLDRVNNDGNYEPGNCRWASRRQQQRNRRNNNTVTLDGVTMCMTEWCEHFGIQFTTVRGRIRRGWSIEDSLRIQVNPIHRNKRAAHG